MPQSLRTVLMEGVEVDAEPLDDPDDLPFRVPETGRLRFAPASLASPLGSLYLRHGLELAWLLKQLPEEPVVAGLLAARVLAELLEFASPEARRIAVEAGLDAALAPLRKSVPSLNGAAWEAVRRFQPVPASPPTPTAAARLAALWPFAGAVEYRMLSGGGGRIGIDPVTGRNAYANAVYPEPQVISWSSCTASTISARGLAAAEACRRRLLRDAIAGGDPAQNRSALHREADAVRRTLSAQWDLDGVAEIVLASSGTDASLILSGLAGVIAPELPLGIVLTSLSETGRGVPRAALGRHYSPTASSGAEVEQDTPVPDFPSAVELAIVPLRDAEGTLLPAGAVAAETARAVDALAEKGQVVLHLLDVSKTGLAAPSFAAIAALRERHGERLLIAVDACQARFGTAQMRTYLDAGAAVLVTGSKFYAGPPFSGALLLPHPWTRGLREGTLPAGLGLYSAAADWPETVANPIQPPTPRFSWSGNLGLVLRWTAAAAEMAAFADLSPVRRRALAAGFEKTVCEELGRDPRLLPLPLPPLARPEPDGWDAYPTIVTFLVRPDPSSPCCLGLPALAALHRELREARPGLPDDAGRFRFQLGQPVEIGTRGGREVGGLRIAASAPLFTTGESNDEVFDRLRRDLRAMVTKTGHLLDRMAAASRS